MSGMSSVVAPSAIVTPAESNDIAFVRGENTVTLSVNKHRCFADKRSSAKALNLWFDLADQVTRTKSALRHMEKMSDLPGNDADANAAQVESLSEDLKAAAAMQERLLPVMERSAEFTFPIDGGVITCRTAVKSKATLVKDIRAAANAALAGA